MARRKRKTKAEKRVELEAMLTEVDGQISEAKTADPFWYYEPSDGYIGDRGKEFLRKYLNEEDIPQKLDGQLDAHLCTANIIAVTGGNQAGKTVYQIIEDYIAITGELPKALEGVYPEEKLSKEWPVHIRVTGVSDRQVNNTVKAGYREWCPRDYLKDRSWDKSFSSKYDILTLYEPGTDNVLGTIEFMNNKMDVEVFQGPPKRKMSYDEEPREAIRKENLRRMTTAPRVWETYAFTPTKGLSWTSDLFLDCNDDEGRSVQRFQLCSVTNKKADLNALKDICDEATDYMELKMRLLGEFVSLSGLVYGKLFDRKIHVIPPFFENLPPHEKKDYLCLSGWDPHGVTPTAGVFMLADREGNEYIDRCYFKAAEMGDIKNDFHAIVKENGYRMGWSVADRSSNSTIHAFGGLNMFKLLSQGDKCIPALRNSEKYEGSIKAGVNEMKKKLKITKKCPDCNGEIGVECTKCDIMGEVACPPTLFIVDRPENQALIKSFRTLERETYANEDVKGLKDKIAEGKHHHHAALRYLHQYPILWYPAIDEVPVRDMYAEAALY